LSSSGTAATSGASRRLEIVSIGAVAVSVKPAISLGGGATATDRSLAVSRDAAESTIRFLFAAERTAGTDRDFETSGLADVAVVDVVSPEPSVVGAPAVAGSRRASHAATATAAMTTRTAPRATMRSFRGDDGRSGAGGFRVTDAESIRITLSVGRELCGRESGRRCPIVSRKPIRNSGPLATDVPAGRVSGAVWDM